MRGEISHTEERLFPELNGAVLADPELLDAFHDQNARRQDLLELYSTSNIGDAVTAEGVAIPVAGLETGYYSVSAALHLPAAPRVR